MNFVKITADDSLLVRTYELGVEKETLSSGTGTVAAALVAHLQHGLASPIHLRSRSEEDLIVTFAHRGNQLSDVYLEGSAYMLFSGSLSYDSAQGSIVSSFDEPVPVYTSNAQ